MRRQIENPCERCGENVFSCDRHGDPVPQHTFERECFEAVRKAAVDEVKRLLANAGVLVLASERT